MGLVTPRVCRPLYARDRCSPDASGAHLTVSGALQVTVRDRRAKVKRATRGSFQGTDAGLERPVVPCGASGDPNFSPMKEPTTLFV